MLTLIFRSPNTLQERLFGPTRVVAITPEAIYVDSRDTPVAEFRYALWHVDGVHYTSAEILGAGNVSFYRRESGTSRRLGPFSGLRIISGYLFDGSQMVARAIGGNWFTYDDEKEYDEIAVERVETPPPATNPGILVVEDNEIERMGLTALLRKAGYTVSEAHNGQDAFEQASRATPDLILLDLQMPHVDGWHFLQMRRAVPRLDAVPVVIVTGLEMAPELRARDWGAKAIVPKPVKSENLLEMVKELVG